MSIILYHNPRCSKSRQALALLHERGLEPEIVEYLESPPTSDELKRIIERLGLAPRALLRRKESEFRQLGLDDASLDDEEIISAMSRHPRLIERPILVVDDRARIGRPPENLLDILP